MFDQRRTPRRGPIACLTATAPRLKVTSQDGVAQTLFGDARGLELSELLVVHPPIRLRAGWAGVAAACTPAGKIPVVGYIQPTRGECRVTLSELLPFRRERGVAVEYLDAFYNVLVWPPEMEALFGWSAEEAIGRRTEELYHSLGEHRAERRHSLSTTGEWEGDSMYFGKDEEPVLLRVRSVAVIERQQVAGHRAAMYPLILPHAPKVNLSALRPRRRDLSQIAQNSPSDFLPQIAGRLSHEITYMTNREIDRNGNGVQADGEMTAASKPDISPYDRLVGQRLQEAREAMGLTQEQAVDGLHAMGLKATQSDMSRWEAGKHFPRRKMDTLIRFYGKHWRPPTFQDLEDL